MVPDTRTLVEDFIRVAMLSGLNVPEAALTVESAPAPHHSPTSLPHGKMAVYVFVQGGRCLKVGKAGPRSRARYTSQHYLPRSSGSNLAKSILAARGEMGLTNLAESQIGAWIRLNVDRYNFLLDTRCGVPALNLLEIFLQCRLQPLFEGFSTQR